MKIVLIVALALAGALGSVGQAAAGDVHGKIFVTKVLTKKRLALPDYQSRGAPVPPPKEEPGPVDEFSRLVVYLDGSPALGNSNVVAQMDQKGMRFIPDILIVPTGSTVSFPNDDPIFHNVFSLSKAKQFDLGYYPAGQTRTVRFDKPGVVQVYCHIHRDMNAAILVVPNTTFVQPSQDGSYTLSGIPPGEQHIMVWHKSAGFFRKTVVVPQTGSVELSFTIPVPSAE